MPAQNGTIESNQNAMTENEENEFSVPQDPMENPWQTDGENPTGFPQMPGGMEFPGGGFPNGGFSGGFDCEEISGQMPQMDWSGNMMTPPFDVSTNNNTEEDHVSASQNQENKSEWRGNQQTDIGREAPNAPFSVSGNGSFAPDAGRLGTQGNAEGLILLGMSALALLAGLLIAFKFKR